MYKSNVKSVTDFCSLVIDIYTLVANFCPPVAGFYTPPVTDFCSHVIHVNTFVTYIALLLHTFTL